MRAEVPSIGVNSHVNCDRAFQAIKQSQVERVGNCITSRRRCDKSFMEASCRSYVAVLRFRVTGRPRRHSERPPINNEYMNMKISMRIHRHTSAATCSRRCVITMSVHALHIAPRLIDRLRSDWEIVVT